MSDWITHPWEREDEEIRQAFAEKERQLLESKQLITELANALVNDHIWYNEGDELIQRARKATKGQP
jgi:hypothetical protein